MWGSPGRVWTGTEACGWRCVAQAARGTWQRFVNRHRLNIMSYAGIFVVILFLFHMISDGDFSFLMVRWPGAVRRSRERVTAGNGRRRLLGLTLWALCDDQTMSNVFRLFALGLLVFKIFSQKTCSGKYKLDADFETRPLAQPDGWTQTSPSR